ncbi:hypothetical protein E1B28_013042 [Marasmius oreades]|uniref:C2H2-type domain-containing protein n=1 Tax=Marasmius oreades TaxID=181124 RepID=A0A9P7UNL6_9AGAR|nr:uncharacterized protein E1B28_013042 [Marasmius oreades]KAG7087061.1 hypothetical protein E1B28_013042 [Marasmius oreades]
MSSHSSQRRSFRQPTEPPVLPGINEMFPEHFMKYTPNLRFVLKEQDDAYYSEEARRPQSGRSHSYDSTCYAPHSPHESHSTNHSQSPTSIRGHRDHSSTCISHHHLPPPPAHDRESSEKKHVCPICSKRFSRPSSLKIHVNTHTGETPFRCPFPGCGREFNVNSNMRRHYRNHAGAGSLYLPEYNDHDEDGPESPPSYHSSHSHSHSSVPNPNSWQSHGRPPPPPSSSSSPSNERYLGRGYSGSELGVRR